MPKKTLPLLACIGVFIAAGGVFLFSQTVTVLSLGSADRERPLFLKWAPSERITFFYTNSIYGAPVEEVFEVRNGGLELKEVRTDSPAVMEYYGFEGSGPVRAVHRGLGPTLSILRSMGQDQGLRIGLRTVDLHNIASPGSRIWLNVSQVSQARFLWWRLLGEDRPDPSAAP